MAGFSWSGSEDIDRGVAKEWTDDTIYSFMPTTFCKIGIDHNPFVDVSANTEIIIKQDVDYIFDRDTTIKYSYPPEVVAEVATLYAEVTSDNDIYSSSGFSTLVEIPTYEELTDYTLYARVAYWKITQATITMKVMVGSTTLDTIDVLCPTSQYTILSFNSALTTTIPANSIIKLLIENGGSNDTVVGSRVPTVLSVRDTS